MSDKPRQVSAGDFRQQQAELLNIIHYAHESIRITKHGKSMGVIIPEEEYQKYLQLLEDYEDAKDVKAARQALEEAKSSGTVSWEDAKRELDV